MDELIFDIDQFLNDLINPVTLSVLVTLSGVFYRIVRFFMKKIREQNDELMRLITRIELLQSIDHDYGLVVVSGIHDRYKALGGNSYGDEIFEAYRKKKEKEEK